MDIINVPRDPLAIHIDEGYIEIVASGGARGDDGNWRLIIVGVNLEVQRKVSGTWINDTNVFLG